MDPVSAISTTKAPCSLADALAVLKRLRQAGHAAFFAGGCVRDLLLGLEPKDYDVATDAPPARVRELFSNAQAVGQAFGVILVRHSGSTVEVATFRSEGAYSDGRRPDAVVFTTEPREDAKRRDFTINGLYLDPLEDLPDGRVIDFVGGRDDLRDRVLRAIGDPNRRLAEDHLRLLRAVRFAARFGLTVEPATASAIRLNAPRLKGISPERVADELRLMLTPPTRARAWALLWEYALVDVIFRFLPSGEAAEFDGGRSLFLRVTPGGAVSFGLALAAAMLDYALLGHARGAEVASLADRAALSRVGRALRDALRISNEELDAVIGIIEPLATLLGRGEPPLAARKRFLARPTAGETRELLRALASLDIEAMRVAWLEERFEELADVDVAPPPLITGDDLVAAGFRPGPLFKRVLEATYDAQLEGRICTRDEAMELARNVK